MTSPQRVVFRDLVIFQAKLFLDGLKDIVLSPVSIIAAAADIILPGRSGRYFYGVVAAGEKFDRWLNLFGAATHADAARDGLFGASRAGSDTMIGQLESFVLKGDGRPRAADRTAR
ncbi:hypothetical protein BH23GEM9_BH23GEM9_16620 [soil metagenome]